MTNNPSTYLRAVCILRPVLLCEPRTKTPEFKDANNAFDAVGVGQFAKVQLLPGIQVTL